MTMLLLCLGMMTAAFLSQLTRVMVFDNSMCALWVKGRVA